MGGVGVIDRFLQVFTSYIDSGFGLLGGDVAFLATTLIVIDVTLAALFWAWGADDDILARLIKKTLASSPTSSATGTRSPASFSKASPGLASSLRAAALAPASCFSPAASQRSALMRAVRFSRRFPI